jgi:anti-sigma-K factor RskA
MLYVAEALDPAEREAIRAHLATGCPRCAGALAEAEATLGHLPLVLDPVAPNPETRAALMRRVTALPRMDSRTAPASRSAAAVRAGAWVRPALAAAAAVLVTFAALSIPGQRARQALLARLDAQDREIVRLREAVHDAAETVRVLRSPAVRIVALSGTQSQPQATARIFWDQSRRIWHFYAADLRQPGPGRTYQLWFITPAQEKISAGTFDVDPQGEAAIEVAIPPGLEAVAVAAVTDEPAGGSPQPTGSIHLAGSVARPSS